MIRPGDGYRVASVGLLIGVLSLLVLQIFLDYHLKRGTFGRTPAAAVFLPVAVWGVLTFVQLGACVWSVRASRSAIAWMTGAGCVVGVAGLAVAMQTLSSWLYIV